MVHKETVCFIIDNSGGSLIKIFHVKKKGKLGARLVFSIRRLRRLRVTKLKKGMIERGILVRSSRKSPRKDGSSIRFDKNGVALISRRNLPKAKRIYGPVPQELGRMKFFAVASVVF
jgi:large subunit ribosomal protein L14